MQEDKLTSQSSLHRRDTQANGPVILLKASEEGQMLVKFGKVFFFQLNKRLSNDRHQAKIEKEMPTIPLIIAPKKLLKWKIVWFGVGKNFGFQKAYLILRDRSVWKTATSRHLAFLGWRGLEVDASTMM